MDSSQKKHSAIESSNYFPKVKLNNGALVLDEERYVGFYSEIYYLIASFNMHVFLHMILVSIFNFLFDAFIILQGQCECSKRVDNLLSLLGSIDLKV